MPTDRRTSPTLPEDVEDEDGFVPYLDEHGYAKLQRKGLPWTIRARVDDVDGVPQITSIHLERRSLDPRQSIITADALRRLPLRMIRETAAAITRGDRITPEDPDPWVSPSEIAQTMSREVRKERRRTLDEDHYEEVARVYRAGLITNAPLKAVAAAFAVSRAMASKYVREARNRRLLGEHSRQGMPGDRTESTDTENQ